MNQATLLIELQTEELPPKSLRQLGQAFAEGIFSELKRLSFTTDQSIATAFMTPRRLGVTITHVLDLQPTQMVERKGPSIQAAYLEDGSPTPALEGFARSCKVPLDALTRSADGKNILFRTEKVGESLTKFLPAIVETASKKLPIPKIMHWGDTDYHFVRPVHGLIMMWGNTVLPGSLFGKESGNQTRGHRFLGKETVTIPSADEYAATLEKEGHVIASFDERKSRIQELLQAAVNALPNMKTDNDDALLEEVTGLVEFPAVYVGHFDKEFLSVPQECLILSMKQHQKYFPLFDQDGKLQSTFIIVSNLATDDPSAIINGNQRVLRARLSDAQFFFEQDAKTPLADRLPLLNNVVYHHQLGTQFERITRIQRLASDTARQWGLDNETIDLVSRAASLCKSDLLTDMVGEFPELQGTMGRYYALNDNENEAVADAIESHYLPRFSGDEIAKSSVAICCALADRLEAIVGIFGIGLKPTGDKDPYGLRRHALAILRILIENQISLDLKGLLENAKSVFESDKLSSDVVDVVYAFILDRLKYYCMDLGFSAELVDSVLSQQPTRIDWILPKLKAVDEFLTLPEAQSLASANKRIVNILKKAPSEVLEITIDRFDDPAEVELYNTMQRLSPTIENALAENAFTVALKSLADLKKPVDAFFDNVMVMAEDEGVRNNRIALLRALSQLTNAVADISKTAK